jgi:hypothetical protein
MVAPPFLPRNDGAIESYDFGPASPYGTSHVGGFHVVADPLTSHDPWSASAIDWETTLAFRHHLWRLGLKIAEATDTSQRGMGLDWSMAKELIRRSLAEAKTVAGADLACGAGTDQLVTNEARSLGDVVRAYEEQIGHVEAHGGRVILIASRALCRIFAIRKLPPLLHIRSRPMTDRLSNLAGTLAHDVAGEDGVTVSGRQHQLSRIGPSLRVTVTRGRPGPHTNRTHDVSTSPSHEVVHERLRLETRFSHRCTDDCVTCTGNE